MKSMISAAPQHGPVAVSLHVSLHVSLRASLLAAALIAAALLTAATPVSGQSTSPSPGPSPGHSSGMAGMPGVDQTAAAEPPATLLDGMGKLHHPVSTRYTEAQKYFDQGLTLVYAFNHHEAVRSFQRAAELDPKLAMAHWGIALALGPNINMDVDPDSERAAYEAEQKALAMAKDAPPEERAYIEALAKRYSVAPGADLKALAVAYKDAMAGLSSRYPDDLDAATLYAESMMDLRPWRLWNADGTPAPETEKIISVLESVLKRDPNHVGANHYYIHTIEASAHPERALPSAERLKTLVPAAGHLVHMPAHIYERTGDYAAAAQANQTAAKVDEAYIKARRPQGVYPAMYYSHNLQFLAASDMMRGRFAEAKTAADAMAANAAPAVKAMPMLEYVITLPTAVLLRFNRWDDIMRLPEPTEGNITRATWHYARGMADAATGKPDEAAKEADALARLADGLPADAIFGQNTAKDVLAVARDVLAGRIALAQGDRATAIARLQDAVTREDGLFYDEPENWYYPVRESLGAVLLQGGKAAEAEAVFRADLEKHPRSGRSLFGLREALKAQGKDAAAATVGAQYEAAWKDADAPLALSGF